MKLAHNSYQFILKLWNCTCCLILCDEPNPKEWQLIVSGKVFAFENVKVLVIELLLTWKITMHMSEYVRRCPKYVRSIPIYAASLYNLYTWHHHGRGLAPTLRGLSTSAEPGYSEAVEQQRGFVPLKSRICNASAIFIHIHIPQYW